MKVLGIVEPNKRQGTKLGYPTANLKIDAKDSGVFVGWTKLINTDNDYIKKLFTKKALPSLIFMGKPKMFEDHSSRVESHIFDFPNIDLYGSEIEIEIVQKIRDNIKYKDEMELLNRIRLDEIEARKWFKRNKS